jgi:hypothetical protein
MAHASASLEPAVRMVRHSPASPRQLQIGVEKRPFFTIGYDSESERRSIDNGQRSVP